MINFVDININFFTTLGNKKTFVLRKILIGALIASFAYLIAIFVYQYLEQQKVKDRLDVAYSSSNQKSSALYRLFSVYSEADNFFRSYTVNFDAEMYLAYKDRLDTIKFYVDSLSKLPSVGQILQVGNMDMDQKRLLSQEFANLKQTVDQLIFYTNDSLAVLTPNNKQIIYTPHFERADSVVNRIMRDTSLNKSTLDTVIRKKENLFNRIFKAKNDTLVANTIIQDKTTELRDVISRNIEYLVQQQKRTYSRSLESLKKNFAALQLKEKELILANRNLLDALRNGIDRIRDYEIKVRRQAEEKDLLSYMQNTANFRNQLIASLIIILLMIILIFYYQFNAELYERKLQEEKDYASKVATEKTTILASVSHEVRTPINSLLGIIDILKKNGASHVVDDEYLESASHEISVINTTVDDILNLSKLEAGVLDVKLEFFSPTQVLDEVVHLHLHQAQKKNIRLVKDFRIDPRLLIHSSEFRLRQIVSNLLSNAIKYSTEGDILIRANLRIKNGNTLCVVRVVDKGAGISVEEQALVFRPYYMAGAKRQTSSFGLGLYISKLFSEQLGGSLELDSELGRGSTFTLSIPVQASRIVEDYIEQYTLSDLDRNFEVVIVDDNRINILYLKNIFKELPNVHIFEKVEEALAYLLKNRVDILITDLHMAGMNGWELLHHVRNIATLSSLKVFAFTADNMYFEVEQHNQAHQFDGNLKKPIDIHNLISSIKKVI